MIRIAGPLSRRFPTARELDDESGHYLNPAKRYGAATSAIAASAQFKLLSPDDVQTLTDFVASIERGDIQAGKLKALYARTGGNLVTKSLNIIGAFMLGAISSAAGPDLVIAQKAADALVASEAAVIELLEDLPPVSKLSALNILHELKSHPSDDPLQTPGERLVAWRRESEGVVDQ